MRTPIEPIGCLELVTLCHQALTPDAPQHSTYYINKILKVMNDFTYTDGLTPEMQERIAQIIANAKDKAPAEVPAELEAECDAEEYVPTLMDHVMTLRQEVGALRQELNAVAQVTDAVGQAVGQMYHMYIESKGVTK